MLTFYSHFPKQIRAQDAIKKLNNYFELQGNKTEPLPTMSKIVDYCIRHPRLLRIRDSPLKILHDPNLPHIVVHDWYIGIALDYLEASLYVLFQQWEMDYKKKRNDSRQIAQLFFKTVNDIYQCYEHTGLPLALPFPEGSALGSIELREKVKHSSMALIKEKVSTSFKSARDTFYTLALKQIESLFKVKQQELNDGSFAYLFSSNVKKYEDSILEQKVQMIIDTNLPQLVDVFTLSDSILDDVILNSPLNDENNSISIDSWLSNENEELEDYKIETLESNITDFSNICEQLNNLNLAPDWTNILKEIINKRICILERKDNWNIALVRIQLKWLHVLILPWISYVMINTENTDTNWKNFLRNKIKAEHVLYEMIYQFRIDKIFEIIRDYPTTSNAIHDFHIVASKRGLLQELKNTLINELQGRLLHQGASATDILQQYIACIQCLSIIDPTCDIMVPVIEVIENYMRTYRNDVVQGVVELIRDDDDDEIFRLADENNRYIFEQSELNKEEIPRDAVIIKEDKPAKLSSLQKKSKDPIAMLISMCNSLSDFIDGYSNKLGEVLLSSKNYDIDVEVKRLELLKLHFPPETFTRCDIMLQDMVDSRRLDKLIHENNTVDPTLHALILSRKYWSGGESDHDDYNDNNDTKFELWTKDVISTTDYDANYRNAKANRRLKFLPTKGTVTVDLEFKSKTLNLDIRPEALPIISLFETKADKYARDDIINRVGFDKVTVIECLEFWMKEEVLELTANGYYQLIEE